MATHCFSEMDYPREELEAQLQQRVTQEFAMVAAYVRTWRGTAAYSAGRTSSVHDRIATSTAQRVLPWPQIQETPTPRFEDGRFCKSFPLHFPMGTADFRQSRLRSDFKAADWCQHLLRYWNGFLMGNNSAQRALWAAFNTVLNDMSFKTGSLVHKKANRAVLTTGDLTTILNKRHDLVAQLTTFGSDIPETTMHWKKTL